MKRMLDVTAKEIKEAGKKELLESIRGNEGRTLVSETIGVMSPLLGDVSNAELAASLGADVIILNLFDVNKPEINGIPACKPEQTVKQVKKLTGRIVGINLEPVEETSQDKNDIWRLTEGRKATVKNARKALEMGVSMIILTGNPGVGVSNQAIVKSLKEIRKACGDELILAAGKMHASGVLSEAAENILTKEDIKEFAAAGADIILMPAPGTVPGITMEYVRKLVNCAHKHNMLTLTAIGTSQEGAEVETIREIALMCKMAGTDMHHLGDSGYIGIALPENILAYSKAIRGARHTYRRMSMSITR